VLGIGSLEEFGLGPEIWGQVLVGLAQSDEGSSDEVLGSLGVAGRGSVNIIDTSELKHLLRDRGSNDTGTTRSGGQLDGDGSALAGDLAGHGVHVTDLVTPIASSDGDELELGADEGTLDGNLDFLGNLHTETNVAILVSNNDDSLEAGSLTGLGLLLDRDDLHDLIGQGLGLEEFVDDLGLLDGDGVGVDFLEGADVTVLNESAELGLGDPFILGGTATAWAITTTTAATTATATTAETAFAAFTAFASGSISGRSSSWSSSAFHRL
jgi:hypothetical protein